MKMDTRVVLIHCGEPTVDATRAALKAAVGYGEWWDLVEVENVSPMDAAFNTMLDLAVRDYHVQVDADMVLDPHAILTLRRSLDDCGDSWWQSCYPLWDTLYRRPISGVKIYRSDIARENPYKPTRHCEVDQTARVRELGYHIYAKSPDCPRVGCIGEHRVADNRTAAWNSYDRALRGRWLVSRGQSNWFGWIEPYFKMFPKWFRETGDERYLWGLMGLVAGASAAVPDEWGEKDASAPPEFLTWIEKVSARPSSAWGSDCYVPLWLREEWGV